MSSLVFFLRTSIKIATVFLFGSIGETITEKGGHLNMGIPGIMGIGAVGGVLGESIYIAAVGYKGINPFLCILIPIIFTLVFGALAGLFFSFMCVTLKSNQNVVGLTLTTFGGGLSGLLLSNDKLINKDYFSIPGKYFSSMFCPDVATTVLNKDFFSIFYAEGILTYIAILLAIAVAVFFKRSRTGLALRSVGENPGTSDAVGLNVTKYKYASTSIGAAIASLGGLTVVMDCNRGTFEPGVIESYGWLAVALVIFTLWRTDLAILGSLVFAALYSLPNCFAFPGDVMKLLKIIPYIITIVVLILTSVFKVKDSQPPASLGVTYFREDR